ncbi:MAG: NAD+ synthase [Bacteroidota bacterium]
MRIALCQINPTVGDLAGNVALVLRDARRAASAGADLAVFPELCVTGYPPQDLLDRPAFLDDVDDAVAQIARALPDGLTAIIGAPVRNETSVGKRLVNAVLLVERGEVRALVAKSLLPTYDVFDEYRYFEPASERAVVEWTPAARAASGGPALRLGLHVCEDMWNNEEQAPYHLYAANPIDELAAQGIDLFVNISASPYAVRKPDERREIIRESAREHGVAFVYVNQVGANTELIFDGGSQVQNAAGEVLWEAAPFQEDFWIWDTEADNAPIETPGADAPAAVTAEIHDALVLGIRDYVRKTGEGVFEKALVGLSGGIDSAVTCALAVEALGADRVVGITMPSAYSSSGSVGDSRQLAEALGIEFHEVSIRPSVDAFADMLAPLFEGTDEDVAEENIQSRSRGLTLMAVSNKFGHLLLTTGNKSEMAVGYATLYGDMSGGLAVLSDVFKLEVYRLARHINARAGREVIPESTITKPPSAELKPGQVDSDSLPPYDVLDAILERYVEAQESPAVIAAETGVDRALVDRIARMVDRNEYKRRQAAPGLRISTKAFGVGRRLPIVMQRTRADVMPGSAAGDRQRADETPAAVEA